jgi:hypothetical protein
MLLVVVFLSQLAVFPLQHFQPLLLGLGSGDLVSSPVFDVLAPVGI